VLALIDGASLLQHSNSWNIQEKASLFLSAATMDFNPPVMFVAYIQSPQFDPVNVESSKSGQKPKIIILNIVCTSSPMSLLRIQSVFSGIELFTPP